MKRPNWFHISGEGAKAVGALHHYVTTSTGLPDELIHLVFLRVSQINGCAHCIDIHTRDLIKGGMSVEKVVLVPVWEEAGYLFTDQERAALAWAEEVTLVSQTHASDDAYAAALAVFGEKPLVELTIVIATMNAINRMGITHHPGGRSTIVSLHRQAFVLPEGLRAGLLKSSEFFDVTQRHCAMIRDSRRPQECLPNLPPRLRRT
ncbi:hypothetical protein Lal_00037078 [Lupinus albus]|nr:hypothetical protein Lal_00037078 [Lupinus albus]